MMDQKKWGEWMQVLRKDSIPTGSLLLATFRTIYCWMFLALSCFGFYGAYSNIQESLKRHSLDKVVIASNAVLVFYAVILVLAWWMILRDKRRLKRWAIAGNAVIVGVFLPLLMLGGWRAFWEDERGWFPATIVGVFGMIIFSIPYRGWRHKSQVPAK